MALTVVQPPAISSVARLRSLLLPALVGAIVFWIAFDGGSYGLADRNSLAIAFWWAAALGVGIAVWPYARIPFPAFLTGGLLALLALLTALSMLWAESNEKAFNEFNRVVLHLAAFTLAVLAGSRASAPRWADGIAVGAVSVALLSLASRFFPAVFPEPDVAEFLPAQLTRLSYPLNYWNALAILIALAAPLVLRTAVMSPRAIVQAASVGVLPALTATVYLTSSRAGSAAAVFGVIVFAALTVRRWAVAGAVVAASAGSVAALAVVLTRDELVNGPLDSETAESEGRSAALLLLVICVLTGIAYALGRRYLAGAVRPGSRLGWAAVAVAVVLGLAGVAAADPVSRFEDFKDVPTAPKPGEDAIRAHLTSASGNGRWQWWNAAVDQFEEHPVIGDGAGSYEAWWAQHGTIQGFVRDAHSLYLETLSELGIIGFLVLVAALGVGIVTGARRLTQGDEEHRSVVAALLTAFLAFCLVAGVDWVWEVPAISLVAMVFLGLLVGPATQLAGPAAGGSEATSWRSRLRPGIAIALIALVPFLVGTQLIPLLSTLKVQASQEAVERGDAVQALDDAQAARELQPWAATPYLQIALVEEEAGALEEAHSSILDAIERDPVDWRLWLVRARLETKSGEIEAARRSLDRAVELNPRSPLFAQRT